MKKITRVGSESITHLATLSRIYNSIKPVYIICKIIGLNAIHFQENIEPKTNKSDYAYFAFYFTTYTLMSAYSLSCMLSSENQAIVDGFIFYAECIVMMTLMLTVVMFTFFTRRTQIKAFELLSHVDVVFIKNGFSLDHQPILKKCYIILSFLTFSLITRSLLTLITVQAELVQQVILLVSAVVKAFSKYQFVVFVLHLQQRFVKINTIIRSFYLSHSNRLVLHPVTKTIPQHLYVLCRLHYKLASVTQKINIAFAVQLLVSVAVSLFDILYQAYFLYYMSAGKTKNINAFMIIAPICWLIDETVEIYWLVDSCASTCEQANETPTILHELRNNHFNIELEEHIQTYSLQMLHQKVQFSVLGFFVVDYTLVYSIAGAVTTYLVIFIQFDQSSSLSNPLLNETSSK